MKESRNYVKNHSSDGNVDGEIDIELNPVSVSTYDRDSVRDPGRSTSYTSALTKRCSDENSIASTRDDSSQCFKERDGSPFLSRWNGFIECHH